MSDHQLIYGLHAVEAVLERYPDRILELFVLEGRTDARINRITQSASQMGLAMHVRNRAQLDKLCTEPHHQGVVARVRPVEAGGEHELHDHVQSLTVPPLLLVLDGVTDPHNLGACLRSADAAGVHAVIAPRDRAAGLSAVVRKVSVGAAEWVPFFQVTNLARTLEFLRDQGVLCVGLSREDRAKSLYSMSLKEPLALVLGSEGQGLRRLTKERCDSLAFLPMQGQVESLNVSVAAGIALYEAVRQRGANQ